MHFRPATLDDATEVARVLAAAAHKLVQRGTPLWTLDEVSVATVSPHVDEGMYHLGIGDDGQIVGVFRLQPSDPVFWPDVSDGATVYLHKLAVHPDRQGQGAAHALLAHAVDLVRASGA